MFEACKTFACCSVRARSRGQRWKTQGSIQCPVWHKQETYHQKWNEQRRKVWNINVVVRKSTQRSGYLPSFLKCCRGKSVTASSLHHAVLWRAPIPLPSATHDEWVWHMDIRRSFTSVSHLGGCRHGSGRRESQMLHSLAFFT